MKRSNTRWAVLIFVCLALGAVPIANAASIDRKFTRVLPEDPNAEAKIAAQIAKDAKLYQGVTGDWRLSPFSPDAGRNGASLSGGDTGSDPQASETPLRGAAPALQTGSSQDFTAELGLNAASPESTTASTNFGGFMDTQLSQVVALNADFIVSIQSADVNNDGHPDIVHLGQYGNVYVQLNDGKGGFGTPIVNAGGVQYVKQTAKGDTNDYAVDITVADVNGDGQPDLIVTQWGSYHHTHAPALLVYLNQGNGAFSAPLVAHPTFVQAERPGGIIVADRDGDGKADILLVSYDEIDKTFDVHGNPASYDTKINVQTLWGNGDGTFQNSAYVSSYTYSGFSVIIPNGGARLVTLAGTPYLAVECGAYTWGYNSDGLSTPISQGVSVLFFQDTDGGRTAQPVPSTPANEINIASQNPYALTYQNGLTFTDLNGDGLPDMTVSFGDNYLYGALGTAGGGFAPVQVVESGAVPYLPYAWSMVDVNGDGYADIIDMEYYGLDIWLGKGDGTFADPQKYYTIDPQFTGLPGNSPGKLIVAADFDGDGYVDYGTIVWWGETSIAKGNGDGTFQAPPAFAAPNGSPTLNAATSPTVIDLNGDGLSDIVALNGYTGGLVSAISDGKGNFTYNSDALPADEGIFNYGFGAAAVADFNNDGYPDILLRGDVVTGFDLAVVPSNHDGTFGHPIRLNLDFLALPKTTMTGDINHDGKVDIVSTYCSDRYGTPSGIWVAMGNGDGTFQNGSFTPFGTCPSLGVLADVNGDGNLDVVVSDSVSKALTMIPGHGTGAFDTAAAITISSKFPVYSMAALDANNDGHLDLAVLGNKPAGAPSNGVVIFLGAGNGTFNATPAVNNGTTYSSIVAADFNGDGCADLFTSYSGSYAGQLTLGNCDGTFQQSQSLFLPTGSGKLALGTFTADGAPSVVGVSGHGVPIFTLYNQGGTKVSLTASNPAITQGAALTFTAAITATWAHRPAPTGTVSFYDNGALLGKQSVVAGSAVFTASGLAIGSHAISVSYSGDGNFNAQQRGAQLNVTVAAPPPPATAPDIAISSPVPNLVLNRGDSTTATFTIVGSSNYTGNVTFSVWGAAEGLDVSVSPTTVSLTNGSSATVSVSVNTVAGATTAMARSKSRWLGTTFGGTALGALFLWLPARRRRSLRNCLLIVPMVALCLMSTSCSGGSSQPLEAQPGISTIVVAATPSVSGAKVRSTSFTVTVQ